MLRHLRLDKILNIYKASILEVLHLSSYPECRQSGLVEMTGGRVTGEVQTERSVSRKAGHTNTRLSLESRPEGKGAVINT